MFNIFMMTLAIVLLLLGLIGAVAPVLPGPPLAWLGLLAAYFTVSCQIPLWILIVCAIVAIIVTILDSILPVLLTKKQQASKYGTWGATIGTIIGFCLGPPGIIFGSFLGALIGELINDGSDFKRALIIAWWSFLGFLCGTGIKLLAVSIFVVIFINYWLH